MPGFVAVALLLSAGWLVVLLAAPGLFILTAVVVSFLFHRPVPPDAAEALDRGDGWYTVLGFDGRTNDPREMTVRADGPAAARGRAEMEGVVVTKVKWAGTAG